VAKAKSKQDGQNHAPAIWKGMQQPAPTVARRWRVLDAWSGVRENRHVGLAEIVLLLVVVGASYAALAPLRKRIERAWLRRRARGKRGAVIQLTRRGDGLYAAPEGKDTKHGNER
jgi:hypothetical protein